MESIGHEIREMLRFRMADPIYRYMRWELQDRTTYTPPLTPSEYQGQHQLHICRRLSIADTIKVIGSREESILVETEKTSIYTLFLLLDSIYHSQ